MAQGFGVNKRGIEKLTREIQREFDKHPIQVPVRAQREAGVEAAAGSTHYYGPVINVHGDRAQLAWGNRDVVQSQARSEEIAPGYEAIAQAVVSTLRELASAGLPADDRQEAEAIGAEALAEVVKDEPNRGVIRRSVAALKGFLSPIALGMATGAGDGAEEWARTAIEQLQSPF